ncbi:MAG TPA: ATP-binding cassette domain-containing protein [Acidimicrobiia bacterium]|nr:ATP-binding cassette domain-containing protein [Acidimicrobiia bacterium]
MLSIQDMHKAFGEVVALDGCTLAAARGTMLGFLGPNGAGKTTAMRSVFGLMRPDSGDVTWDGHPIGLEQRRRFGYMPEQRGLYPRMKTHDQLTYLGRLRGMTATAAGLSASQWLERFGLGDRGGDAVETLSHGNQQRVQLAAALIHDPELLVLDEPFSGLDPIATETMAGVLREQAASGKAVIFSSHQLDLVEDLCEEVAIINKGLIVVEGAVRSLKDAAPIRHLEVEVDGDASALFESLSGIRSIDSDGNRHHLIIEAGTDVRGLLVAAQEGGRLRHFSYTAPSLSDLFREAVK